MTAPAADPADDQPEDRADGWALAVDIGGTKVDAALVSSAGQVMRDSLARRPTGRASTREQIADAVRGAAGAALQALPPGDRVAGVGIGSAGPVDIPRGTVAPINLPAARDLPVTALLADLVPGAPVALALDGTCIALAEHWLGALAGSTSALAMVVSTGVGGGFITDGRPVTGASGNAGHIGQIRVGPRNEDDPSAGTVEAMGAGPGTVAWARAQGWDGSTGEELAAAYRAGDEIARRAVARSARAVGEGIATASTLFDLQAVAIAGGFVNVADDYVAQVQAAVDASALHAYARAVRVTTSGLGGDGPLIGAAALILRT